jgi:predicted nucleotidyltransferase
VFDLRALRERAGLSQADLARLTGIAASNLSAYEAGKRRASPAMERRLRDALTRPSERLRQHRTEVLEVVKAHGAENPRVFGSVTRGEDGPGSDVDLLVRVDPVNAWRFVSLASALEELLGVPVDVVSEGGLKGKHAALLAQAVPL